LSVSRRTCQIRRWPNSLTTLAGGIGWRGRQGRRLRGTGGDRAADGLAHEQAARLFDLALHSLELRPTGPETELRRVDLHTRRASCFGALGQWTLEVRELEAALQHLDPQKIERRCELVLALARAGSSSSMSVQWNSTRPKRCSLPKGCSAPISPRTQSPGWPLPAGKWDLGTAIDMDRRAMSMHPA